MNGLTITKRFAVNLTADQWQLYTESMDCTDAALQLNAGMTGILNSGLGISQAMNDAYALLGDFSKFGASDSEPIWVAERLIQEALGKA
jgi:hypothetical protein